MSSDSQLQIAATTAAEEVLRIIYGDDLEGCTVSLDRIAEAIAHTLQQHAGTATAIGELHRKGFEAVQLLATPPADGNALSAEDLRSLLGERLDSIRNVATKILDATREATASPADGETAGEEQTDV
ncbi:MAG: hypothetical protein M3Z64_07800 [Verrucomicrobiota bacterium]|nr:hypothetical protein [Verrucomicrobiota bacterium]